MKKFFIFSTLAILLIGCSDSEINNPENIDVVKIETQQASKSVEDNIDALFYNYINSFEYKESNRLLNIFQAKFKVSVSKDDFNTDTEMLQWIGLNLDKTYFSSLEEAQTEWQPISNLLEINYNNNQELFEFVRTSNLNVSIPYFEKWILRTTTEDDECTKQIKQCEMNALVAYVKIVVESGGGTESLDAIRSAHFMYNKSMTVCADNFEACVANL